MKYILKGAFCAAVLACALPISGISVAVAQERSWNDEQTEVWSVVAQSWVDDSAENGKWPVEYLHEDAIGFSAEWPNPRGADSISKWSRFGYQANQTLQYELFPMAISIAEDTAVVHYSTVIVSKEGDKAPERSVGYVNETLVKADGEWKFLSLSGWNAGSE